jgi:ligand-binding sensor domain-containing protein
MKSKVLLVFVFLVLHSAANRPDSIFTARAGDGKNEWKGTTNGLIRINLRTNEQQVYTTLNSVLPSDSITCICVRSNGDVWIGTPKGIVRYDQFAFLLITTENSNLPENAVTGLKEDNDGALWISTRHYGQVCVRGLSSITKK